MSAPFLKADGKARRLLYQAEPLLETKRALSYSFWSGETTSLVSLGHSFADSVADAQQSMKNNRARSSISILIGI